MHDGYMSTVTGFNDEGWECGLCQEKQETATNPNFNADTSYSWKTSNCPGTDMQKHRYLIFLDYINHVLE